MKPVIPKCHEAECADMAQYGALMEGPWDLEYRQLSAGSLRARNHGIQLGAAIAYEESFNRKFSVVGALGPNLVGFSFPDEQTAVRGRWWGKAHPRGGVYFATGGGEIDVAFPGGYRNILVLVDDNVLRENYFAQTGEDITLLRRGAFYLSATPSSTAACRKALEALIDRKDTVHLHSDAVVTIMVKFLSEAVEQKAHRPYGAPAPCVRTRLVRRALDIWNDSMFQVSIAELSREVGTSQRTLEYSFRDHFGHTPHQYLKRSRLGLVREALQQADPSDTSVTEIAMEFGFWELGRFAGDYRRFFGELPSQTLANPSSTRVPLFP